MSNTSIALPDEYIEDTILLIRGKRVILDHDLARLYDVSTKVLNQAVKRNVDRFPEDFMFQLTKAETEEWQRLKRSRSQIVTLNKSRGTNIKYQPYAFTEHGILMLSSVLKSQRAVQVNIQIMRTFVRLREMLQSNETLIERLDKLEDKYDTKFKIVFSAIRQLINPACRQEKANRVSPRASKNLSTQKSNVTHTERAECFKIRICDLKRRRRSKISFASISGAAVLTQRTNFFGEPSHD